MHDSSVLVVVGLEEDEDDDDISGWWKRDGGDGGGDGDDGGGAATAAAAPSPRADRVAAASQGCDDSAGSVGTLTSSSGVGHDSSVLVVVGPDWFSPASMTSPITSMSPDIPHAAEVEIATDELRWMARTGSPRAPAAGKDAGQCPGSVASTVGLPGGDAVSADGDEDGAKPVRTGPFWASSVYPSRKNVAGVRGTTRGGSTVAKGDTSGWRSGLPVSGSAASSAGGAGTTGRSGALLSHPKRTDGAAPKRRQEGRPATNGTKGELRKGHHGAPTAKSTDSSTPSKRRTAAATATASAKPSASTATPARARLRDGFPALGGPDSPTPIRKAAPGPHPSRGKRISAATNRDARPGRATALPVAHRDPSPSGTSRRSRSTERDAGLSAGSSSATTSSRAGGKRLPNRSSSSRVVAAPAAVAATPAAAARCKPPRAPAAARTLASTGNQSAAAAVLATPAATTFSRALPVKPTPLTAGSVSRGTCAWCGGKVLVDQERVKDGDGKYLHRPCAKMRRRSHARARMGSATSDGGELTLASLPDELLLAVLVHLPKPELLRCGAVCSLFRRVSADPRLWKVADFSGRILSPHTLEVLGKRGPVAADFGRSSGVTSGGLIRFLKGCGPGIEQLNMLGCGTISDASLRHIALACVRMTALDLSWCNVSDTGIELLVEGSIEGLASIKLQGCSGLTDASVEKLCRGFRSSLKQIDLFGCYQVTPLALATAVGLLPELSAVCLAHCPNVTAELVTSYISRLPLVELDLRGCKQVTDASVRAVAANCSGTLRKIKLGGCNLLSDESLKSLVVCTELETLDLKSCKALTDTGLVGLFTSSAWPTSMAGLVDLDLSGTGVATLTVTAVAARCHVSTFRLLVGPHSPSRSHAAPHTPPSAHAALHVAAYSYRVVRLCCC